ncbi:spore gernimation protein GerQ [Brevibacillus choshinensis]|uniref:Spore gernimation protein GerQ n=1 Tax=Brevibacillus choshinensis TaxID=54911 RepID=A0ABR5NDZ0_BRECH|nr:spore coat protein [Brevibacillus choshinensis]KQL49785.1 spore gernimation protein GerQ [Brevibacillus choshinensis]
MSGILQKMMGIGGMTDQVVAMDLLIAAKSGVRNYAMALTDTGTPEIKATLTKQLEEAIDLHEKISMYLIELGWYHPWYVSRFS